MIGRIFFLCAGVLTLCGAARGAVFTDDFLDDGVTQANWVFLDAVGQRDTVGLAGGGQLKISANDFVLNQILVGVVGNPPGSIVFDGSFTRIRAGVRWTQQQLDDRQIKGFVVRLNLDQFNGYYLNIDPGSSGANFFSLRRFFGGGESLVQSGPLIAYQPDVDYQVEFGIDGDSLWGRLWIGDNYNNPVGIVSATDDRIPAGGTSGNVLAGVITNIIPFNQILDSTFVVNELFGGAFEVTSEMSAEDFDGDGVTDDADNCLAVANADQADGDSDGVGDVCDGCPDDTDVDGDGVCDVLDNCPNISSSGQPDRDADGIGDLCDVCPDDAENDVDNDGACGDVDNCPEVTNSDQADGDEDGVGDVCDTCPNDAENDADGDGLCGDVDVCPDDVENDADGDGVCEKVDNCRNVSNADQADLDDNGVGDACEPAPPSAPGAGGLFCGTMGAANMAFMLLGLSFLRTMRRGEAMR